MKTKKFLLELFSLVMITFLVINLVTIITGIGGISFAADDAFSNIDYAGAGVSAGITVLSALAFQGIPLLIIIALKLGLILVGFIGLLIMSGIVARI